ncbi:MAG: mycothiol synthase [Acidimicrobiia bacterium]|nr:mycothiol synthase [Acidimicrobiia bacterium]
MDYAIVQLRSDRRNDVLDLVAAVQRAEGAAPLSEYKMMRLDGPLDAREQISVLADGSVVGYAQAAWHRGSGSEDGHWAIEVVVAPQHRGGSVTGELIESLREDLGVDTTTLWAREEYVAAAAASRGWHKQRVLWEMHRPLPVMGLETKISGFQLANFRMGIDEAAWLDANNAAFAGHPENGDMTRRDLEKRMSEPWFDPDGFFLAWDGDRLAGSCWTKVHEDGIGEIYIIGVVPAWEGRGLGNWLVSVGLDYLGNVRHVRQAMLFVESDNERAVQLYERLGFEMLRSIEAYRFQRQVSGLGVQG